jgi:hypothetical protein
MKSIPHRVVFFLSTLVTIIGLPQAAGGAVLIVNPQTGPFTTIQQALDLAAPADTIEINPGIYDEELFPRVSCTMRSSEGRATTILEGGQRHRMIASDSLDLVLEGLTFRNGHAAAPGGGAILFAHGELTIRQCDFRDNAVARGSLGRNYGGAIYAYGWNFNVEIEDCLFRGNKLESTSLDCAGAIGLTQYIPFESEGAVSREGTPEGSSEIVSTASIVRSTFIANKAPWGAAIYGSGGIGCEIDHCLFVDLAGTDTDFVALWEFSTGSCNIEWPYVSPIHQGTWYKTGKTNAVFSLVDPRLCPDDSERIHETSPAITQGCGAIGTLPVGCGGPMLLAVRPLNLEPRESVLLFAYGYGLDQATAIALVGQSGQRVAGTDFTVNGTDLSARFDLRGQDAGYWTLVVSTPSGDAAMDSLVVSPIAVRGLLNGWITHASVVEGTLFGEELIPGMTLNLRNQQSGSAYPVEILQMVGTDSLRIRSDLGAAPDGVYDLDVALPSGSSYSVPAIAYVGAPPSIRVPEDYATIGEALAAAPPCAEIQVGPGTYNESLTVVAPVRIVGSEGYNSITIQPPAGSRGIHVLPSAGPLTEIHGLTVSHGSASGAPGGGIFCETPARIEGCYFRGNTVSGSCGRGGGIYATAGCRIIGNQFFANSANRVAAAADEDPWSPDPTLGGIGGGLYCKSCMVAGNTFDTNQARDSGAFVMEGILRGNHLRGNWSNIGGLPYSGAARGEITRNYFDNECGAGEPYLLIEGPAVVAYNTANDIIWDLCNLYGIIHLRGSIDFSHNTLCGVSVMACLTTDDDGEVPPGHFRMRDNIFSSNSVELRAGTGWEGCRLSNTESPRTAIPADSIDVACNLIDSCDFSYLGSPCPTCGFQGQPMFCELPYWVWEDGYWWPMGDFNLHIDAASEALPENRDTPACGDTLGALGVACGAEPVLLGEHGVVPVEQGVRIHWVLPVDVAVSGYEIERGAGDQIRVITPAPLPACHTCEFIDREPPVGYGPVLYRLVVLLADGGREVVELGAWSGDVDVPHRLVLRQPAPHPMGRGASRITVGLPVADRARIDAFDAAGRWVATVCDRSLPAGWSHVQWDGTGAEGRPLASGLYFLRLTVRSGTSTRKVMVIH